MNKPLLFLILFVFLSSSVLAIPVSYEIELSEEGTYEIKAVSEIGESIIVVDNGTFGLINHMENNGELVEFYVDGEILRRVNQSLPGSVENIFIVTNGTDKNKDGIIDDDDTNPSDDDGDGILGDESYVSTNVPKLELKSNSTIVNFTSEGKPILEFEYNLTSKQLNTSNITIKKQPENATKSYMLISGIALDSKTKTIYMDRVANTSYICIKDVEVTNVSEEPSDSCNGANESPIKCDGTNQNGYTCQIVGTQLKISGLKHSFVKESDYTPPVKKTESDTDTSSGRRSGGGGGFVPYTKCESDWFCDEWSDCEDSVQTCLSWSDLNECNEEYLGESTRDCTDESQSLTDSEKEDSTKEQSDVENSNSNEINSEEKDDGNLITGNVIKALTGKVKPIGTILALIVAVGFISSLVFKKPKRKTRRLYKTRRF
jgi:hypothetical protein